MPSNNVNDSAFLIASDTHPGSTGKNNEDYLADFEVDWQDELKLRRVQVAVVADGIGGNNAGEVASKIAVEKVQVTLRTLSTVPIQERLERAVQLANQEVFNAGQNNPAMLGMGSTLVIAAIVDDQLYVAHVGDSRAYLVRGGKALPADAGPHLGPGGDRHWPPDARGRAASIPTATSSSAIWAWTSRWPWTTR